MGYYKYQSVSYSTVGSNTDEAFGSFKTRPLVPYPNVSSEDYYDHNYDYVPKRTLVPIATRPYGDAYRHGSPTRAYPTRHDDEWHSPRKADEFLPKRTTVPVTTRPYGDEYNYIHGSPTKAYSPRDDDEWLRQTSPVRDRPQRADEFKRTTVPVSVATRPDYGGHEYKHGSPARREAYPARDDDKWHPQNQNSSVYGHPQKQKADELLTRKPLASVATRPYGPEYERISPSTEAYPARDDQKWHRTQKPQPVISPDWRRSTANNGNYKPIDSSDDAYGRRYQQQQPSEDKWNAMQKPPNGSNKAIINPGWSSSPRKGTQVSGPTNDIDTFVGMLKQATLEAEDKRGTKPTANSYAFPTPRTINSTEAEKKYKGARV